MPNAINEKYNQLIKHSPVPLKKKLTPKAFTNKGDQIIMVCNPGFPTIGNCRFYQAHGKLNKIQRKELHKEAESLDLSVIPALNIDLDSLSKYKKVFSANTVICEIVLSFSLSGNIRLMDKNEEPSTWIKTGKDSPKLTIKAFEIAFFSKWKISVVYAPPKGVMLKLVKEDKKGEEIELIGAIKKSKHNDGFEATLYPLHSDQIFHLGPIAFGGEFGFKVEITGQWQQWQEDDFGFPDLTLDFSEFYTESSINAQAHAVNYTNIIAPGFLLGEVSMHFMLSVLWKWYASLPTADMVKKDMAALPLVSPAGAPIIG